MKKEIKIIAIVLAALIVFLGGFGLGASKGITISVKVDGQASEQAAAPTTPATSAPATTAPAATTPPATSAPAAETPSQDTSSETPDSTAAPAPSGIPSTTEEIVAKYNEIINNAKSEQNVTLHKVSAVTLNCTDCSVGFLTSVVNTALKALATTSDNTFTVTNGVCTNQDGEQTDLNSRITPGGRQAALEASHVASATATAEGDGYTMNITLNAETSTFDGTNTVNPVGHESVLDPLNLATLELPIPGAEITQADMSYPGATLAATVNGAGKITKLVIHLPMSGNGTGAIRSVSLSVGIEGAMDDTYDFTY